MIKEEKTKTTIKIFIIIYIISFIFINWNDVSWLFNYKAVSGLVDDFFTPYPSIKVAASVNDSLNLSSQNSRAVKNIKPVYTDKENSIEIPVMKISAPIIFSKNTGKNLMSKDLNNGVVYYPGSVLPGQNGQIIILGHSAPLNWPKIKYDWVFSRINDLEAGDEIIVNLENKQYLYIVKEKTIIEKGKEIKFNSPVEDYNSLILVSCWPPGKDTLRIAVKSSLYIDDSR